MKTIKSEQAAPVDFDRWFQQQRPGVDAGAICDAVSQQIDKAVELLRPLGAVSPGGVIETAVKELKARLRAKDVEGFDKFWDDFGNTQPDAYDLLAGTLAELVLNQEHMDWEEFDKKTGLDKITASPMDFDRWMQNHGPKNDTPAPKPTPAPAPAPTSGRDPTIPAPYTGPGHAWDSDTIDGENFIEFACKKPGWFVVVVQHPDGSHQYGYMTPDGDVITEDGSDADPIKFLERAPVERWLEKQGVPLPGDDDWHRVSL